MNSGPLHYVKYTTSIILTYFQVKKAIICFSVDLYGFTWGGGEGLVRGWEVPQVFILAFSQREELQSLTTRKGYYKTRVIRH